MAQMPLFLTKPQLIKCLLKMCTGAVPLVTECTYRDSNREILTQFFDVAAWCLNARCWPPLWCLCCHSPGLLSCRLSLFSAKWTIALLLMMNVLNLQSTASLVWTPQCTASANKCDSLRRCYVLLALADFVPYWALCVWLRLRWWYWGSVMLSLY